MKIAIVGFGRMGKKIREIAEEQGHEIVSIIDPWASSPLVTGVAINSETLSDTLDVVIDFSSPAHVVENMSYYIQHGIPAVIGTTGWYEKLPYITQLVEENPLSSLIYSGNFSVGVALYREVVAYASRLFGNLGTYDISLNESHHKEKKDSPSGTALLLGQTILDNFKGKDTLVTERLDRKRADNELHVSSTRCGWDPRTHHVVIASQADTIELIHRARSREGFARGAVVAAQWIHQKKGLYNLDDLIADLVSSTNE